MTGTVLFALRTYGGLDWTGELLSLNPRLSPGWIQMDFNISFRGNRYYFQILSHHVKVKIEGEDSTKILIKDQEITLQPGVWEVIDL